MSGEEVVIKWDQGKQTKFEAVEEDQTYMRKIVNKDFIIYVIIYLFAPTSIILNKYADYPLRFSNKVPWIVVNTALSIAALLTLVLPSIVPDPCYLTNIERRGALFAFILRCVLTACIEALNIEPGSNIYRIL